MPAESPRVLLLANPAAHGGRARKLLPRVQDFLVQRLPRFEYQVTGTAEELRDTAREAARAGYDRVLVAGGDGSAHAAVNGLRGSSTVLGVVPMGHGNDLCRALGIPLDPISAADFLLRAPAGEMDLVSLGERVFAIAAGVGFDAEANRLANSWPGWPRGHLRYWLAGFVTMLRYRPQRIEFTTDAGEFAGEALWVVFANTPCYGGGLRIAPQAHPGDGWLDICVIAPLAFTELLDLYPALYAGRHTSSPHVRIFRAREVDFRAPAGMVLYGDGERLGETPFRMRVEPRAVRVLHAPPAN